MPKILSEPGGTEFSSVWESLIAFSKRFITRRLTQESRSNSLVVRPADRGIAERFDP
jgi:hypothetical protein